MNYAATLACEYAAEPRCRCHCAGRAHGRGLAPEDPAVQPGDLHWQDIQLRLFHEEPPMKTTPPKRTAEYRHADAAPDAVEICTYCRRGVVIYRGFGTAYTATADCPHPKCTVCGREWPGAPYRAIDPTTAAAPPP